MHVTMIEEQGGSLAEVWFYCSQFCASGDDKAGAWPGGMETDSDVFCSKCGDHMWHGLQCNVRSMCCDDVHYAPMLYGYYGLRETEPCVNCGKQPTFS